MVQPENACAIVSHQQSVFHLRLFALMADWIFTHLSHDYQEVDDYSVSEHSIPLTTWSGFL